MLSINIHVHERVDELRRLLASIAANKSLSECRCLVINNANAEYVARAVAGVISEFPSLAITELNQLKWQALQASLSASQSSEPVRRWFAQMRLGEPGWAVHAARNIGMIAAALLHQGVTHVLNLDSDILVPSELQLSVNQLPSFGCLQIRGCPDLSRLEWIELLCRVTAQELDLPLPRSDNYVNRLVGENDTNTLQVIVTKYTDLLPLGNARTMDEVNASIVPREEYYGACYILRVDRFGHSPVPPWYDNDWSFFSSIREEDDALGFLPYVVEHAASQKRILCQASMHHEEHGKLLYLAARNGSDMSSCESARAFRLNEIRRISNLVRQVHLKCQRLNGDDTFVRVQQTLQQLHAFVAQELDMSDAQEELRRFTNEVSVWRGNFPLIKANSRTL